MNGLNIMQRNVLGKSNLNKYDMYNIFVASKRNYILHQTAK
jgi:hypothetical protein